MFSAMRVESVLRLESNALAMKGAILGAGAFGLILLSSSAAQAQCVGERALSAPTGLNSTVAMAVAGVSASVNALVTSINTANTAFSGIRPQPYRRASDRHHCCQLARPLDSATVVTCGMSAIPSMAAAMAAGVTSLTGQ